MLSPRRKQMLILIIFLILTMFTMMMVFSAIVPKRELTENKFTTAQTTQTPKNKATPKTLSEKENEQETDYENENIDLRQEKDFGNPNGKESAEHNEQEFEKTSQQEKNEVEKKPETQPKTPIEIEPKTPIPKVPEAQKDFPLTIGVIPEHQDSFYFLLEAIRQKKIPRTGEGVELLQIDSHSSGLIPQDINFKIPKITAKNSLKSMIDIFQHLNHDDMIPTGQYMGLFSNKVNWIRSVWDFQKYELPIGEHKIKLGRRRKIDEDQSFLCYKIDNENQKKIFSTFLDSDVICKKPKFQQEMTWNVMSLDDSFSKLNKSNSLIINLDLDFFSTKDQVIDQIFHSRKIIQKYFDLLETFFVKDKLCFKDKLSDIISINKLLQELFLKVKIVDDNYLNTKNETLKLWCKGEEYARQEIKEISKIFDYLFRVGKSESLSILNFEHKFPSINCKVDGYFGVCESGHEPYHDSTKEEIQENLTKLIELLKLLENEPKLILISRSLNGYTPFHSFPFIEKTLLKELNKLYPKSKVKYFKSEKITTSDEKKYQVKYKPSTKELNDLKEIIQKFEIKKLKKTKVKKLKMMKLFLQFSKKKNYYLNQILFNPEIFSKYEKWLNSVHQ
eukprot:gene1368-11990_t